MRRRSAIPLARCARHWSLRSKPLRAQVEGVRGMRQQRLPCSFTPCQLPCGRVFADRTSGGDAPGMDPARRRRGFFFALNRSKTMATRREPKVPADFVGSVRHALAVLKTFDKDNFEMTLSTVSERTGMTRAGARRYL